MGKYSRNTYNGRIDFTKGGDTMDLTFPTPGLLSQTMSEDRWKNADGTADIYIDAPVERHVGQNYEFESRYDVPFLQIGTFEESPNYVHSNGYTANREYLLEGVARSYITPAGGTVGHNQGSLAINNNAAMCISGTGARIRSGQFQKGWQGALFAFMFSSTVLTQTQVEEVNVNFYKLLA